MKKLIALLSIILIIVLGCLSNKQLQNNETTILNSTNIINNSSNDLNASLNNSNKNSDNQSLNENKSNTTNQSNETNMDENASNNNTTANNSNEFPIRIEVKPKTTPYFSFKGINININSIEWVKSKNKVVIKINFSNNKKLDEVIYIDDLLITIFSNNKTTSKEFFNDKAFILYDNAEKTFVITNTSQPTMISLNIHYYKKISETKKVSYETLAKLEVE